MMRLFWLRNRLSWPFVIFVVYITVVLIVFDFSWRVIVLPFDTLLLSAIAIGGFGAIMLYWIIRVSGRSKRVRIGDG